MIYENQLIKISLRHEDKMSRVNLNCINYIELFLDYRP